MSNLKLAKQSDRYLLLFILASTLIHSLSLFLFQMYKLSQPEDKDKTASKPIEFVAISPKESSEKPPLETQKRSLENSVAKRSTQPQKAAASQVVGEPLSPKLIAQLFPPIRILKPKPAPPQPRPPIPVPKPKPAPPQPSPPIPVPKQKRIPVNPPAPQESSVATRIPPPPPPPSPQTSAASLLGDNYKRSLNDGKGDDFLNPEELTQQTAFNPS